MKKPHECAHEQFAAAVNVHRLLDSGKFMAEVNVRCVDCDEPFRFIGLPAGINFEHPTVSIDGLTLHAPIEPEVEKRLMTAATFHMPAIPPRH
jgi:hypothetical protein